MAGRGDLRKIYLILVLRQFRQNLCQSIESFRCWKLLSELDRIVEYILSHNDLWFINKMRYEKPLRVQQRDHPATTEA